MKKYFVVVSVAFFVLTFSFVNNKPAQAFEKMCCLLTDGSCAEATSSATSCSLGTAVECASCTTAAPSASTTKTSFDNPLGEVSTISAFLQNVLNSLTGIIASIAIIFIVIGGFMYILSAGDEKMITRAKATITAALVGLAITLAAPTFLNEIMTILGKTDGQVSGALTLEQIVTKTLNLLLSIVGIVAMIGVVIGGSFYFTAYGDEKRIETGKSILTNSLIGIAIAMAALIFVKQVASLLGVQ